MDEHITGQGKAVPMSQTSKNPSIKTPVTCSLLSTCTIDAAARAYTDVFVNDEPMTRQYHIDPATFLCHARHYIRFCADTQLSIIAWSADNNECAGFILCCDLVTDFSCLGPDITAFLSFFPESVALIDTLEDTYLDMDRVTGGNTLHIFQMGVRRSYRNRGIATDLIRRICVHAQERGFNKIVADCTGPVSRHVFERCGFGEIGHIPYDTFRTGSHTFFAGLEGGISLMSRDV